MKSGGYSSLQIAKVLSKLIIVASIIVMLFNFFVTPLVLDYRLQLQHQIIHEQKIYSLKEKNFNTSNDKSKVVYINNKSNSESGNIFIKSKDMNSHRIDLAGGMEISDLDSNLVILKNGSSYVFNADGSLSSTNYVNQDILLLNKIPELIFYFLFTSSTVFPNPFQKPPENIPTVLPNTSQDIPKITKK